VIELTESDLYDIKESQYVRKADVDEEVKESRLEGLKDQLAAVDSTDSEDLQREIEELESRIDELTGFKSGATRE
jgi:polyhydroxyalkanoate synthesis regulator phasin